MLLCLVTLLLISLSLPSANTSATGDPNDPQECLDIDAQSDGDSYQGKVSVAYDGTECQPWSNHSQFWRRHWSRDRAYKEINYCRNPDNDARGPWCVVHKSSFKYCNVPRCGKDVGCYEDRGEDYGGYQDRTVGGLPCKNWNIHAKTSSNSFRFRLHQNATHSTVISAFDERLKKFNYCRNPGGTSSRPWCYTIAQSGSQNEKNYCDIPSCDGPSILGYPLMDKDSACASNFFRQIQVISMEGKPEIKLPYCIAPERILHPAHRREPHSQFTEFCLFPLGKSTHCPADEIMRRTLEDLQNPGVQIACEEHFVDLEYVDDIVLMVEEEEKAQLLLNELTKVIQSFGFRRVQRFQPMLNKWQHISGPTAWRASGEHLLMTVYCCSDPKYFIQYHQKPYILIEKISSYKRILRSDRLEASLPSIVSLLQSRMTSPSESSVTQSSDVKDDSDFDSEKHPVFASVRQCPPVPNMLRLVMPTAQSSLNPDNLDQTMPMFLEDLMCEYYTLPSPAATRRPTSECFRPNEIHFHLSGNRLKLCCTGTLNQTNGNHTMEIETDKVQAPFKAKPPFVVIQNGNTCPNFYSGTENLAFVQYTRPMPRTKSTKMTLIGPDDPLRTSEGFGVGVCQYITQNGFHHRSGVVRLGTNIQPLGNLCCRTEESVGAIRFPIKLEAPFKLPAIHRPCQAIENFNVDSELQFCVYYPQGIRRPERSSVDRLMMYFSLMHDQWLTNKRPRWLVDQHEVDDICFNEVHGSSIPATTLSGKGYCLFVFGSCPKRNFEMLGASPYMNSVLCCTVAGNSGVSESNTEPEHDTQPLRSFVTLGHASAKDIQELNGFSGTKVLELDTNTTSETCPQFANLVLRRRVVEGHIAPPTMRLENTPELTRMFNVTHMSYDEFKQRTGIWARENIAYTHYCEYSVRKTPSASLDTKREGTFEAIFKGLGGIISKKTTDSSVLGVLLASRRTFTPISVEPGMPIHLDGIYLRGDKRTWLQYCVFTSDGAIQPTAEDYVPAELPPGHYCVLRVRSECPSGFSEGVLSIIEGPQKAHPRIPGHLRDAILDSIPQHTPVFDITRTRLTAKDPAITVHRLDYHFCCRADSPGVDIPIQGFPTESGAFFLYRSVCAYLGASALHNAGEWPVGAYALPNAHRSDTENACPPGFTQNHMSLVSVQTMFYELEIIPTVIGSYFLEIIGHNQSALNVHYCDRDRPSSSQDKNTTLPPPVSAEQLALQWPKGDYCVISTDLSNHCPPGLNRHSRSVAELCCRTDKVQDPVPVDWPFTGDFFLFGGDRCLPIKNTHVERYPVRLLATNYRTMEAEWDVLCHYIPIEWTTTENKWPSGDYMLPIGRRSGLKSSMIYLAEYVDDVTHKHINSNPNQTPDSDGSVSRYKCPETFQRARFTFVSKNSETRQVPREDGGESQRLNVVAMTAMEFCIRENDTVRIESGGDEWPNGDYCVFTMNTECPTGMRATREAPMKIPNFLLKSVDILDEYGNKMSNKQWHEDADNHVVYFMRCCREDHTLLLRLPPSSDGFYLARSSPLCSIVPGTLLDQEQVATYLSPPIYEKRSQNLNDRDLTLYREFFTLREGLMYLCYYHPGTGLDYSVAIPPEMQHYSTVNLTEKDMEDMARLCGCAQNAVCIPHRRAECFCKPGYYGDGRHTCRAITPLTDGCANLCDNEAICVERLEPIFHKKKRVRLCGCAQNAVCIPHRRAECFCKPGYYGDGRHTCRAITPLTDGCANLCDNEAICVERLEPIFHKKKRVTSHYCVCREGYLGDGFTCHPSCTDRDCRPFSRCVHNVIQKTTKCECLEGTIESVGRCNLDIYRSVQHEKDLPQFLVHHDHCLSKATQLALRELTPSRYFYVFVPDEMLRTCHNITTHIVVRKTALTESELNSATAESPVLLVTENNTVIEIYPENGTWVIDGNLAQTPPVRFVNGEMYAISAPLKLTPYVRRHSGYYAAVVIVSLLLVVGLALLIYKLYPHRHSLRMPFITGVSIGRTSGGARTDESAEPDRTGDQTIAHWTTVDLEARCWAREH
ncbi:hypothetical protein T265_01652 [Opisthorchis viverrini]|uniref:Kringle domain protein n=1 Tax=Opisthorchis viverrini TaxID=6198 RepID=A0A075A1W0_OPIVI|nr:hypothetical protein T265_01652 [Opisthorchis viverrini]KER32217.1 hypothetical protein T265_01652 [Opisthorchis viverrini]